MRVVVNELAALGPRSGIGHYTVELLRGLRRLAPTGQIDGFPQGWLRRGKAAFARFRARRAPRLTPEGAALPPGRLRSGVMHRLRQWGQAVTAWSFRAACARNSYELYHEPNYIPLPTDLPTVATVHDLSALLHPEWHPADRAHFFQREFHKGLARCRHVLAVSEFTRQEVIRTLGLPPERVTRTYNGIRSGLRPLPRSEVDATLRRLGLPEGYLLYLGTLEPRKNLLVLLHAYCGLPTALRRRWPLLLVGAWGWKAGPIADFLQRHGTACGVLHLGYVAERHLAALYNGARALVYPSLYEGFGLPPVEMLACGGAVLASTAGALAETVGGQAHLIAPEDGDGWRQGMRRVLEDDDWWLWLRQGAAAAAQPFTWERCAADTLRVYRAVCQGSAAEERADLRIAG